MASNAYSNGQSFAKWWENLANNYEKFAHPSDNPYDVGYELGKRFDNFVEGAKDPYGDKNNSNADVPSDNTSDKPPAVDTGGGGYDYDYYASARKALEEAYANARASASNVKTDTIASAYDKYLRATQSYGVEAENLSNAGLSASGGYGQLMNSNRFNAYSNLESNANSGYQKAINDINLAENADKVDLEFQKYQMAMAKEQEKYNNTQTNLSTASALASSWAKVEENKIVNEADVRAKLKKNFDFNDDYIDAIISSLMKG